MPSPAPSEQPFGAKFSAIQASVFTPTCAIAGCHQGAAAPQGLRLDEANSFGLLVNQPSSENPAVLRVAPHDADASYLVRKLEGTASVGAQMPLLGPTLGQPAIDIIRQWITEGAIDDRVASMLPLRVRSLSPLPGTVLTAPPTELVAMFDREIDVSTVNATTMILEGSGGDLGFDEGNEVAIMAAQISAPTVAPMSVTFELDTAMLADDTYRVRLLGSGGSVIMDLGANALDGEFSGTFPSGDGQGGGDFVATFSVVTPAAGQLNVAGIRERSAPRTAAGAAR